MGTAPFSAEEMLMGFLVGKCGIQGTNMRLFGVLQAMKAEIFARGMPPLGYLRVPYSHSGLSPYGSSILQPNRYL